MAALERSSPGSPHLMCAHHVSGAPAVRPAIGLQEMSIFSAPKMQILQVHMPKKKARQHLWIWMTRTGRSIQVHIYFIARTCVPNKHTNRFQTKTRYHLFLKTCCSISASSKQWIPYDPIMFFASKAIAAIATNLSQAKQKKDCPLAWWWRAWHEWRKGWYPAAWKILYRLYPTIFARCWIASNVGNKYAMNHPSGTGLYMVIWGMVYDFFNQTITYFDTMQQRNWYARCCSNSRFYQMGILLGYYPLVN